MLLKWANINVSICTGYTFKTKYAMSSFVRSWLKECALFKLEDLCVWVIVNTNLITTFPKSCHTMAQYTLPLGEWQLLVTFLSQLYGSIKTYITGSLKFTQDFFKYVPNLTWLLAPNVPLLIASFYFNLNTIF